MTGRGTVDFFLTKNRDILSRASMMADQKASIILGSEFIILTLIISGIWNPGGEKDSPVPPLWSVALVISIIISVVYALCVLVPSLGFLKKKKQGPNGSLLFFSAIAEMERDDYIRDMKEVLSDDEKIYDAILADMHSEAKVLKNKKYRFLKISYQTLIFGMPISMMVFLLERHEIITAEKILGPLFNL